jgi:hypothetical protein
MLAIMGAPPSCLKRASQLRPIRQSRVRDCPFLTDGSTTGPETGS